LATAQLSRVPFPSQAPDGASHAAEVMSRCSTRLQGKIETQDFDVFLCHQSEDKPAVKEIGNQLKDLGILPWLDEWELRPGLPWQRSLEKQIGQIK
jgi:TIR domain